jgi:outer membrane biosynthesis protein TonB
MLQVAVLLAFALLFSGALKAQEWQEVSQETAASHLLRKVEPDYPAFAKAAGVEGVVRIRVGIYTDGRIHSVGVEGC